MKKLIFIALAPLVIAPVFAQSPSGDGTATVRMTPKDCERLVRHTARADVDFKPGVDVRGKSVAPADLPGTTQTFRPPDHYEFVVAINPLAGTRFTETTLPLGVVKFDIGSGRLTFNGAPLGDALQDQLAEHCRRIADKSPE